MSSNLHISPQQEKYTKGKNPFKLYKDLIIGENKSYITLFVYECLTFIVNSFPSIVGLILRIFIYKLFLQKLGKSPYLGKRIEIRNPSKISIGSKALIEDSVVLDARGEKANISIGKYVLIGKNSLVISKNGLITLEDGVNISSFCRIATQSKIRIGKGTLVSAYSYIGPGNHTFSSSSDKPRISQGMDIKGGVNIGDNCWIGTRATILDGVKIGNNSIIGAHSFVNTDVPDNVIVAGCPAKIIRHI